MNLQETRRDNPKVSNVSNRLTTVLFIIYLIAIGWILLLKLGVRFSYMGKRSVNLIPFSEPSIVTSENILNVIVFVPLGIYTGTLFDKWIFGKKLLFFFLISLSVEVLQFMVRIGAFDVTDIINNTLGGLTGLMIFEAIKKAVNSSVKAQKIINIIAVIGTVIMILMLSLLKMNMLPVRYQ